MQKIANLDIEDAFFMGVSQKIRLTGNREMTYDEIDAFAAAASQCAEEDYGFSKVTFYMDRNETAKFLSRYKGYVTPTEHGIRLNDGVTYDDILKVYPLGVLSVDMLQVFLDLSIGREIFGLSEEEQAAAEERIF